MKKNPPKKKPAKQEPAADSIVNADRDLKLGEWWESDESGFSAGTSNATNDERAISYWMFYPSMTDLEFVSTSLDIVHHEATRYLMKRAVEFGLNDGPLWPAMLLCERLVARNVGQKGPLLGSWPECFRDSDLSDVERATMDAGDAVFMQLVVRLNIELPVASPQLFTKDDLRQMTGLGDTALTMHTKAAGVSVPRKGGKNHRYLEADVRRILEQVINNSQDSSARNRCKAGLQSIGKITS